MNAPQKIAGFAFGLAVVFAVAFGAGVTLGPDNAAGATDQLQSHDQPAAVDQQPAGLSASEDGYTVELAQPRADAGMQVPLRFRIVDATGAAVTRYVDNHEKQLHLIVVRRDLTGYQHVPPVMSDDGTWSVPVDLSAGDYRVFADFIPAVGDPLALGADLHVAGRYDPQSLPSAATTATVDGYTVTLTGDPTTNSQATLTFSVTHNGKSVSDLQPYLGAYGHLVALRVSDLAYLHVHPMGEPNDGITTTGPEIAFGATVPSAGDYRLFLDFKHDNVVRTAEFTLSAAGGPQSAEPAHGH